MKNFYYYKSFSLNQFRKIGLNFLTLEEGFQYLINIFQNNKVSVIEFINNKHIVLLFETDENKRFEILLIAKYILDIKLNLFKKINASSAKLDNTFIIFESKINSIFYLIYSIDTTIYSYNLYDFSEINRIKR